MAGATRLPGGASHGGTSRRTLLAAVGAAAATPALAQVPAGGASKLFATVETRSGRIQGLANSGVWEFKGVPYGASTTGRNRFMPPRPVAPWTGVRECFGFGQISPQVLGAGFAEGLRVGGFHVSVGGMGEDCLSLNIWSRSLERNAKRAVIVWFHGGGFSGLSGNAPGFDGKALATNDDVVVVTVNHRLGSLGYINLVGAGAPEAFRYAGVAGLLDLVAALAWVRDNIEAFGGDPARVMICGQSGGGSKCSALLAMPPAVGLFHRAGIQSGAQLRLRTPADGAVLAEKLLKELGLTRANAAEIQKLPWSRILEAQAAVGGDGFGPVIGTDALPTHPFDPVAPQISANIPVMVSTTLEDVIGLRNFDLDEAGLVTALEEHWPGHGQEIATLSRRADPKASPYLLQLQVFAEATERRYAYALATRKAAQRAGPVYMYQWDWRTPAYDGRYGAGHGADTAPSFHATHHGAYWGWANGRRIVERFAAAWTSFAKTGDPANLQVPAWPAYDDTRRAVMIFNDETRVVENPRGDLRAYLEAHPAQGRIG